MGAEQSSFGVLSEDAPHQLRATSLSVAAASTSSAAPTSSAMAPRLQGMPTAAATHQSSSNADSGTSAPVHVLQSQPQQVAPAAQQTSTYDFAYSFTSNDPDGVQRIYSGRGRLPHNNSRTVVFGPGSSVSFSPVNQGLMGSGMHTASYVASTAQAGPSTAPARQPATASMGRTAAMNGGVSTRSSIASMGHDRSTVVPTSFPSQLFATAHPTTQARNTKLPTSRNPTLGQQFSASTATYGRNSSTARSESTSYQPNQASVDRPSTTGRLASGRQSRATTATWEPSAPSTPATWSGSAISRQATPTVIKKEPDTDSDFNPVVPTQRVEQSRESSVDVIPSIEEDTTAAVARLPGRPTTRVKSELSTTASTTAPSPKEKARKLPDVTPDSEQETAKRVRVAEKGESKPSAAIKEE